MRLTPTPGSSFLNTVFSDESGRVLYKVESPHKTIGRKSTITKPFPEDLPRIQGPSRLEPTISSLPAYDSDDDEKEQDPPAYDSDDEKKASSTVLDVQALENIRFAHLATIEWVVVGYSKFQWGGERISAGDYFRDGKLGFWGFDRVFTGVDNKEYRWRLGMTHPVLWACDPSQENSSIPVAKWHRRKGGVFEKNRPAYLEVNLPADTHHNDGLLDQIMVTFVYIEKHRRDCERAVKKWAGPGGE